MSIHLIIDGYNLIRRSPSLNKIDRQNLEAGREELIGRLSLYKRAKSFPITVVFDGADRDNLPGPRKIQKGIHVIFSRMGQKADDVIIRMATEIGQGAMVVTSDRQIQLEVERHHATVIGSEDFERKMGLAASIDQKGIDPDDLDEQLEAQGTRKKGPPRRLSRKLRRARQRIEKL